MTDIPDNVDLNWIARTLLALRDDVRDLKGDLRHVREDVDVVAMRVIRIDASVTALRDDIRDLAGRDALCQPPQRGGFSTAATPGKSIGGRNDVGRIEHGPGPNGNREICQHQPRFVR